MGKGNEIARRLVKQLRRDLKGIGWGAKKRALEAAGLSRAYLENVKPERIPLGTYFQLLEGVGIEPVAHTRRALADNEPIQDFIADARNIAAKSGIPPIVRLARKRGAPGMPEDDAGEDLDAIDRIRFRDPAAAARRIERLMPRLSGSTVARRALATWGSAKRALGDVDIAAIALGEAARRLESSRILDQTSMIVSQVVTCLRYRRQHESAFRISRHWLGHLFSSGRLEGAGLAAVEVGVCCRKLEMFNKSEQVLRVSECFPVERRVASCRRLMRAANERNEGDLTATRCHLRALRLQRAPDQLTNGCTLTAWGDLERDAGNYSTAASSYQQAVPILEPWPFMALQAAIHEVAAHLQAGMPHRAARRARDLEFCSGACSFLSTKAPIMLDELIAAGHRQDVPLPLVDSLIEAMNF